MNDYIFEKLPKIVENEPIEIVKYIDKISIESKLEIFPNLKKVYHSNPSNLLDLILISISFDKAKLIITVGGIRVKKTNPLRYMEYARNYISRAHGK